MRADDYPGTNYPSPNNESPRGLVNDSISADAEVPSAHETFTSIATSLPGSQCRSIRTTAYRRRSSVPTDSDRHYRARTPCRHRRHEWASAPLYTSDAERFRITAPIIVLNPPSDISIPRCFRSCFTVTRARIEIPIRHAQTDPLPTVAECRMPHSLARWDNHQAHEEKRGSPLGLTNELLISSGVRLRAQDEMTSRATSLTGSHVPVTTIAGRPSFPTSLNSDSSESSILNGEATDSLVTGGMSRARFRPSRTVGPNVIQKNASAATWLQASASTSYSSLPARELEVILNRPPRQGLTKYRSFPPRL